LRSLTAAAVAAALAAAAGSARAAPCGRPDLVDMVPGDGATGVPVNATLAAHYQASADYLGEDVVLVAPGSVEEVLPATFDATEGRLAVTPPAPLVPGGSYIIRWPALRGLSTAMPGTGGQSRFTVGTAADAQSPVFGGATGVAWDLERRVGDCSDDIEERMVFDVSLTPASDDGGRGGLTLLLFQTVGPHADGRSIPVLSRALPAAGAAARVALATPDAVGEVCFAALVRDTTGKVSASGSEEACVVTTAPPFFNGCSVGAGGARAHAVVALALALAVARARRRRALGGAELDVFPDRDVDEQDEFFSGSEVGFAHRR